VHESDTTQVSLLQFTEIGQESILFQERIGERRSSCQNGSSLIGRISGIGNEHFVTGVQVGEMDVTDSLFGSDERENLCLRVEFDLEPGTIPLSKGLSEFRQAAVRSVVVVPDVVQSLLRGPDDVLRRLKVRVADSQVNKVYPPT